MAITISRISLDDPGLIISLSEPTTRRDGSALVGRSESYLGDRWFVPEEKSDRSYYWSGSEWISNGGLVRGTSFPTLAKEGDRFFHETYNHYFKFYSSELWESDHTLLKETSFLGGLTNTTGVPLFSSPVGLDLRFRLIDVTYTGNMTVANDITNNWSFNLIEAYIDNTQASIGIVDTIGLGGVAPDQDILLTHAVDSIRPLVGRTLAQIRVSVVKTGSPQNFGFWNAAMKYRYVQP